MAGGTEWLLSALAADLSDDAVVARLSAAGLGPESPARAMFASAAQRLQRLGGATGATPSLAFWARSSQPPSLKMHQR